MQFVPKEETGHPECAHPQRCSGWIVPPEKQAGWLSFRLPDLHLGMVAICCGAKGCGRMLIEAGATFLIDGEKPKEPPEPLWGGKCAQVQAAFEETSAEVPRDLEVSVRLPALKKPLPPITHVFGL
jgi:hypothetical protein